MSDKKEFDKNQSAQSTDRVGDILRKERVTRRITVETIAKDLKLNVKYIKALEANDYGALPAAPYVRVYLRSIAKYLSLDSEAILSAFYEEKGMDDDMYPNQGEKLRISVQEGDTKQNPTFIVAIVLILMVGIFAFVANQQGWINSDDQADTQEVVDQQDQDTDATDEPLEVSPVPVSDIYQESLESSEEEAEGTETGDTEEEEQQDVSAPGPMELQLSAVRDSVWVHVFSDGESWRNFIYHNRPRNFTAADSFNVRVGNNSLLNVSLNGEPVRVNSSGVTAFRIDREGHDVWPTRTWNNVFRGRL
ncbi:helix-turn-helix domain-containing protein [Chitinispirillales bacterium ANBcel5]|uniref:RodZ domain-containing protein n=1 Tax=Cellulosispirillum alkaliphilum TaxID=3039283 RepID=UPI002A539716|nr:helix-turn-helix domain-containing protein [Chitinispirillales bacterium ANBcel5]